LAGFAFEFLEDENASTVCVTLFIEFEARLSIREIPEILWTLSVHRPNVVVFGFEFPEVLNVVSDSLDRLLQDRRVDLFEVESPVFERRERVSNHYHPDALAKRTCVLGYLFKFGERVVV
jgi:hypothetical protein